MAQPTPYNRQASFSNLQAAAPDDPLPGSTVDAELNAVKVTLDGILANLALIQRDDGDLVNDSVGRDQLAEEVDVGFNAPEVWVTGTAYVLSEDTVFNGSGFYRCLISHTAGTFATDLAAAKWELIVDLAALTLAAASAIAFTPASTIAATTVQAAIEEVNAEKAALSHTHTASAISDSTAAGRNMLTAATLAAQKTLLELGDLAFLDSITVNAITGELSYSGAGLLEPAALAANANDWSPTGIATAHTVRASASSAINITGILAPAIDGTILILENIGSFTITLTNADTASAAANRLLAPHPVVVRPNQSVVLKYDKDATTPRWRLAHNVSSQPVAGGFKNLYVRNGATPAAQMKATADALTLEDTNGEVYRARSVDVTAGLTVAGANGLDTGAEASDTWYYLWVIYNPTTNTVAALLSASSTAPTMPSGYTFKARVGANRNDGSSNLHRINQYGRVAQYAVTAASATTRLPELTNGTSGSTTVPTWTGISVLNVVPATAFRADIILSSVAAQSAMAAPNDAYGAIASTANPPPLMYQAGSGTPGTNISRFMTLESTNIYYASAGASTSLMCAGWEDNI